jgi:hypothetical protein
VGVVLCGKLDQDGLGDAIAVLFSGRSAANVWVDWRTRYAAAMMPDTPITIATMHDESTDEALRRVEI